MIYDRYRVQDQLRPSLINSTPFSGSVSLFLNINVCEYITTRKLILLNSVFEIKASMWFQFFFVLILFRILRCVPILCVHFYLHEHRPYTVRVFVYTRMRMDIYVKEVHSTHIPAPTAWVFVNKGID